MIIMTHINLEITTFDNGGFPEVSKNFFKLQPFSIPSIYLIVDENVARFQESRTTIKNIYLSV